MTTMTLEERITTEPHAVINDCLLTTLRGETLTEEMEDAFTAAGTLIVMANLMNLGLTQEEAFRTFEDAEGNVRPYAIKASITNGEYSLTVDFNDFNDVADDATSADLSEVED